MDWASKKATKTASGRRSMYDCDNYDEIDRELWDLVSWLHMSMIPFNPPLESHVRMIAEVDFEDLPKHVQKVARYLQLSEEEARTKNVVTHH